MRFNLKTIPAKDIYPIAAVTEDGIVVSRYGCITYGWEIELPVEYTVFEEEYDNIIESMASAIRVLPDWAVIHKQDIFVKEKYHHEPPSDAGFLVNSYFEHFEGREYPTHHSYLFLTFSTKNIIERKSYASSLIKGQPGKTNPQEARFSAFLGKCKEFISIYTSSGLVKARELTITDWLGDDNSVGIVQKYMMLGDQSPLMSDIGCTPDEVCVKGKSAYCFNIYESSMLPSEVDSVTKVDSMSGGGYDISLSTAARLGVLYNGEHIVNQYIVVPSQQDLMRTVEKEKHKMNNGADRDTDNRINAAEIQEYQDEAYRNNLLTVKSNLNIIAICKEGERDDVCASISTALSSIGISATMNTHNTPSVYYAGIPGNSYEIGYDNLMTNALQSSLCFGNYETFDNGIPGGFFYLSDRARNIPIPLDTQRLARKLGLIDNYNAFVLGPSGTGKSYFMNNYLKFCYANGESVFIIDVGDSYEGLCGIVNEESGGVDGQYHSWDMNHPFSFNPFDGIENWLSEDEENLRQDENGVNFFLSFLQTVWTPKGGWTNDNVPILRMILFDFLIYWKQEHEAGELPILNDFYNFISDNIWDKVHYETPTVEDLKALKILEAVRAEKLSAPRHRLAAGRQEEIRTEIESWCLNHKKELQEEIQSLVEQNGYCLGKSQITPKVFDIEAFQRALSSYVGNGVFAFLMNNREPQDLFSSRFVVFEVDALSQVSDEKFYSLCILCIMNAFEQKMRKSSDFKVMVIEEAWKAIANETMAPFLAALWKTARKFQTAAMVVTQEMNDILGSTVIKDTIFQNSSIRILLEQSGNKRFEETADIMSLSKKDRALAMSIKKGQNKYNANVRQVFITLGSRFSGVYDFETSKKEGVVNESDKVLKAPFIELAKKIKSYIKAAVACVSNN